MMGGPLDRGDHVLAVNIGAAPQERLWRRLRMTGMGRELGFLAGLVGVALWSSGAMAAEPAKVALLTEHLDRASQLAVIEPFLPAIGGTLCAAGTVALAVADSNEFHASRTALLLPTTLCTAASFGSYLLPREYQGRVVYFSAITSVATLLAVDALTSPYVPRAERVTVLGFTGGGVAVAALGLIDAALERPVSRTTLASDAAELRARGASLSPAEGQRIEADFQRYAARPIPRWAYGATLLVSGAVALSPALFPSTSYGDKVLALDLGGVTAVVGALSLGFALATDNQYEQYKKASANLRLSPVGPRGATGLWATGTF